MAIEQEMKRKTKQIALDIIGLTTRFPDSIPARVIARQVMRSASSVGANYRAACRARSGKDFLYKLKVVEEEADETLYWLELLEESGLALTDAVHPARFSLNEVLAITVTAIKTMKEKLERGK